MIKERLELLNFTLQLVKTAGEQIIPYYNNCLSGTKVDGTEVTEADKHAEHLISESILRQFPDHGILGEEFGVTNESNKQYQWIIDPIDGTAWFTLGVPIFGTLIALLKDGEPVLDVVHFPVTKETVYAGKELGCWFKNDRNEPLRIRVKPITELKEAVISASGVHSSNIYSTGNQTAYNLTELINKVKKFRFCGDCLQHALLCRGRIHAAVDTLMQPWDCAAIIPCIEEAGGIVTTLNGEREGIVFGGSLLASSDPSLHNEILRILHPSKME